jgi:hypothetical protein
MERFCITSEMSSHLSFRKVGPKSFRIPFHHAASRRAVSGRAISIALRRGRTAAPRYRTSLILARGGASQSGFARRRHPGPGISASVARGPTARWDRAVSAPRSLRPLRSERDGNIAICRHGAASPPSHRLRGNIPTFLSERWAQRDFGKRLRRIPLGRDFKSRVDTLRNPAPLGGVGPEREL